MNESQVWKLLGVTAIGSFLLGVALTVAIFGGFYVGN